MKKIFFLGLFLGMVSLIFSQQITNVILIPTKGTYCVGDHVVIKWSYSNFNSSSNNTSNNVNKVRITLWREGGTQNTCKIDKNIPLERGNTGYSWTIPATCINPHTSSVENLQTTKVRVKVRWQNPMVAEVSGTSPFFNIGCPNTANHKPELVIQEIIYRPDRLNERDNVVSLYTRVANTGRTGSSNFKIKMILRGPSNFVTKQWIIPVDGLRPHTSTSVSKGERLDKIGLYRFTVTVDEEDEVDEVNEGNNEKYKIFALMPMCDLQVYLPGKKPFFITQKRKFTAEIKNVGHGTCPPTFLHFYVKEKGTRTYNIPRLEPGKKYTVTRSERWYTAGTRSISVRVDPDGKIEEIREDNNYKKISVKVRVPAVYFDSSGLSLPAHTITDTRLNVFPLTAHVNERVQIVAEVVNVTSNVKSKPGTKLVMEVEGLPAKAFDVPELFPGEKFTMDMFTRWDTTGTKKIKVYVTFKGESFDEVVKNVTVIQ